MIYSCGQMIYKRIHLKKRDLYIRGRPSGWESAPLLSLHALISANVPCMVQARAKRFN